MTPVQDQHFHEEDAEKLLGSLAGIVSAHIVTDAAGRMVEIHILSTPDLHPKQVVRNVESALSAGLGVQVDRRIVSVAQIRTEVANGRRSDPSGESATPSTRSWARPDTDAASAGPEAAEDAPAEDAPAETTAETVPEAATDRLEYVRYEARRSGDLCACEVVLRSSGGEVIGIGEGPDTAAGRAEAAARAVFDGIGRARPDVRLKLEAAVISSSRGRSFVIVSAHSLLDRSTVPLAGAAALHRSPEEAGILAALQASNRWSG